MILVGKPVSHFSGIMPSPDAATAHRHPRLRIAAIMIRPSGGTGWADHYRKS
jgi:hypothetical protein